MHVTVGVCFHVGTSLIPDGMRLKTQQSQVFSPMANDPKTGQWTLCASPVRMACMPHRCVMADLGMAEHGLAAAW